jgi:peptidyl-prolyl cis-trans isomerase SurA
VAAQVGDDTIRLSMVDRIAGDYCSAVESQLADSNRILPNQYLRSGIVGQLALVSAARQLAAEHGVEAGVQHDRKVGALESAVATLPEEQREAVLEVEGAPSYLTGVVQAVGEKLLAEDGTTDPTLEDAAAEGQQALTAWLSENDVEIDPQFGLVIEDGRPVAADTSISYGVGEAAEHGQAETPDQAYAASLPDPLRCG